MSTLREEKEAEKDKRTELLIEQLTTDNKEEEIDSDAIAQLRDKLNAATTRIRELEDENEQLRSQLQDQVNKCKYCVININA